MPSYHHVESRGGIMDLVWAYLVGRGDQNVGLIPGFPLLVFIFNRLYRASQILLRGSVKKLKLDDYLMIIAMVWATPTFSLHYSKSNS